MNRLALRRLIRNVVAASLPLVAACDRDTLTVNGDLACKAPVVTDMGIFHINPDFPFSAGGCWQVIDGGYPVGPLQECGALCTCTWSNGFCRVESSSCGQSVIYCAEPGFGRVPAGLAAMGGGDAAVDPRGAFWAQAAWLEAASVHAFRAMAAELSAHGAPARLVAAAREAAREEEAHARVTRALARRHGVTPPAPSVTPPPPRPLVEVAEENASEGCARETCGAAVMSYQARAAAEPRVRRALGRIAVEEVGHAELSWEVAAWAEPRLTATERARVNAARLRAFDQVEAAAAIEPAPLLIAEAGLPPARVKMAIAGGLRAALATAR